ncbi:MAG: hypothetical protein AAB368_10000, partial [bacterium]
GDLFLIARTVVYDILERRADPDEALRHYTTELDTSWLQGALPAGLRRATMLSADRDGRPEDVAGLVQQHDARIVDWESGAIARVCALNRTPCLILRGVSDVFDATGGEATGDLGAYREGTRTVMPRPARDAPRGDQRGPTLALTGSRRRRSVSGRACAGASGGGRSRPGGAGRTP